MSRDHIKDAEVCRGYIDNVRVTRGVARYKPRLWRRIVAWIRYQARMIVQTFTNLFA